MFTSNNNKFVTFNILYWCIAFIGIFLRISQYLSNNSLWRDESRLVLNIIERSFSSLSLPLSYEQAAPFGFLYIEKLASIIFGLSEFSFRLFPLFCGIISIFLFFKLIRKIFNPAISCFALCLFAFLPILSFYSSQVKPYSSDILIAILLLLTTLRINLTNPKFKTLLFLLLEGIVFVWFSYPAIFILLSNSIYLLLFLKPKKENLIFLSLMYISWAISFLSFYYLSKCVVENSISVKGLWESTKIAEVSTFYKMLLWIFETFSDLFNFISLNKSILILVLVGIFSLYKKDKKVCTLLFLPLFLLSLSFIFKFYPPGCRFLLFIIPLLIIFISESIDLIANKAWKNFPIILVLLIGFVFYSPTKTTLSSLREPPSLEEIKPVLSYIRQHLKSEDVIYLNNHLQYSFKYYAKNYGFNNNFYVFDTKNPYALKNGLFYKERNYSLYIDPDPDTNESCLHLFDKVKGNKRVWVIYSTYVYKPMCDLNQTFKYLDSIGIKLNSYHRPGIKLFLYNLQE